MTHKNSATRVNFTKSSLSFLCNSLYEKKALTVNHSFLSRSHCVHVISFLFHSELMIFAEYQWVNFVFKFCVKKSSVGFNLF